MKGREKRPSMSNQINNVILFGASGAGKSSVVNMLAEKQLVKTSNDGSGTTKESKPYIINIGGKDFRIYDTAGFDDGEGCQVPAITAVVQLYKLLKELDGVSLLVYCMRGPRVKESAKANWMLFYQIICSKQVPIVAVITGLEEEEKMREWWPRNRHVFEKCGLCPVDVACITAIEGKNRVYQQEFRESKLETQRIIKTYYRKPPWRIEKLEWFKEVFNADANGFCLPWFSGKELVHNDEAIRDLVAASGMSSEAAEEVVAAFSEVDKKGLSIFGIRLRL